MKVYRERSRIAREHKWSCLDKDFQDYVNNYVKLMDCPNQGATWKDAKKHFVGLSGAIVWGYSSWCPSQTQLDCLDKDVKNYCKIKDIPLRVVD